MPSHRDETNAVMLRNRRIGVGLVDVTGWLERDGASVVIAAMRQGYGIVRKVNQWVNSEAGIPEAIRVSTCKPGGTIPKVAGRTSGIGYPTFNYTLMRVRVAANSPVRQILEDANIPFEPDINDPKGTLVFEWPVLQGPAKPATEASLWEQAMNLVMLQREWSDNAVSNTLYFRPKWQLVEVGVNPSQAALEGFKIERDQWGRCNLYQYDEHHEEDDVERVLSMIAPLTKSVSLLPHTPAGVYPQSPQTGITQEEYERRLKDIKPVQWNRLTNSTPDIDDDKYCSSGACLVPR
jgi:ribonucleoside-diphosphate reductase alpha chain